ncbi:acetate kinase [Rubrivivax sp. JA1024]|nr:acetate kinase [Rubrivivax sp. JA1024]
MDKKQQFCCVAVGSVALALSVSAVRAQTPPVPPAEAGGEEPTASRADRMDALRQRIEAQRQQLETLQRTLAEQEASLREMRRALGEAPLGGLRGGTGAQANPPASAPGEPTRTAQAATASGGQPEAGAARTDVASTIFEQPGVLTPRGKFSLDTSLQYAYSSNNRIALVGYTVIPAILIGLIDIREVQRTTVTAALTGRYGVSNRFEIESRVPWVYRSDTSVGREYLQDDFISRVFDASGSGIGDIEFTGRYQLNDGGVDKPYYIASLRLKTRTGTDPFEVLTSTTELGFRGGGIETELPTGSGFYSLQPALTVLYPTDPAVFFGTVSYLHSFSRDVTRRTDQGPERLGRVSPGDVFSFNFGMGLGLNERSSFSIGYEHSSVGKTKIRGKTPEDAVRVDIGTLLLGYSLKLDAKRSVSVSLGAGLTRDTPDLTLTVRMPYTF